jgi:hypothetical protein
VFPHSVNTRLGFVDETTGSRLKFVDKAVVGVMGPSYGSSCPKGPTQTDR